MGFQTHQPIGVIDHSLRGINIEAFSSWNDLIEYYLFRLEIKDLIRIKDTIIPAFIAQKEQEEIGDIQDESQAFES